MVRALKRMRAVMMHLSAGLAPFSEEMEVVQTVTVADRQAVATLDGYYRKNSKMETMYATDSTIITVDPLPLLQPLLPLRRIVMDL